MLLLALITVALPLLTIGGAVAWGWRHGTLTETASERHDWEFEKIVRRF
jgi:hypothetical protein